jgi:hypothetical protein
MESFDDHRRTDLDYTAEAGWYEKEGCKYGSLRDHRHVSVSYPGDATQQAIAEQRRADTGDVGGVLTDPERVAVESLKSLYPGQAPFLRSVKKTSARQVFRWKKDKNQIVVVVTRPYWLSL